jgi:hypothetical protein
MHGLLMMLQQRDVFVAQVGRCIRSPAMHVLVEETYDVSSWIVRVRQIFLCRSFFGLLSNLWHATFIQ